MLAIQALSAPIETCLDGRSRCAIATLSASARDTFRPLAYLGTAYDEADLPELFAPATERASISMLTVSCAASSAAAHCKIVCPAA